MSEAKKATPAVYLSVENRSATAQAFKIKTTAPRQFCVKPCVGQLLPNETARVEVRLATFELGSVKFQVQAVVPLPAEEPEVALKRVESVSSLLLKAHVRADAAGPSNPAHPARAAPAPAALAVPSVAALAPVTVPAPVAAPVAAPAPPPALLPVPVGPPAAASLQSTPQGASPSLEAEGLVLGAPPLTSAVSAPVHDPVHDSVPAIVFSSEATSPAPASTHHSTSIISVAATSASAPADPTPAPAPAPAPAHAHVDLNSAPAPAPSSVTRDVHAEDGRLAVPARRAPRAHSSDADEAKTHLLHVSVLRIQSEARAILRVTSIAQRQIAFKIKTTAPLDFIVRPSVGVLDPNELVEITVQPMNAAQPNNDAKFQISAVVLEDSDPRDAATLANFFKSLRDRVTEDLKLRLPFEPIEPRLSSGPHPTSSAVTSSSNATANTTVPVAPAPASSTVSHAPTPAPSPAKVSPRMSSAPPNTAASTAALTLAPISTAATTRTASAAPSMSERAVANLTTQLPPTATVTTCSLTLVEPAALQAVEPNAPARLDMDVAVGKSTTAVNDQSLRRRERTTVQPSPVMVEHRRQADRMHTLILLFVAFFLGTLFGYLVLRGSS